MHNLQLIADYCQYEENHNIKSKSIKKAWFSLQTYYNTIEK